MKRLTGNCKEGWTNAHDKSSGIKSFLSQPFSCPEMSLKLPQESRYLPCVPAARKARTNWIFSLVSKLDSVSACPLCPLHILLPLPLCGTWELLCALTPQQSSPQINSLGSKLGAAHPGWSQLSQTWTIAKLHHENHNILQQSAMKTSENHSASLKGCLKASHLLAKRGYN